MARTDVSLLARATILREKSSITRVAESADTISSTSATVITAGLENPANTFCTGTTPDRYPTPSPVIATSSTRNRSVA